MKGAKIFKRVVAVVLLTMFLAAPAVGASEVFVHFIVVPTKARDGRDLDKAMADLKVFFAELAGGYTHLGATDGGYLPPGGTLQQNANDTFLVAASQNLTPKISAYVARHFETEKPYILVWKAVTNY